jgi:hypothetical protein
VKLTEAEDIVRSIRNETTEICIRAIESLYLDSQGMILCADTIDACATMLRNLKAGRTALEQEREDE